MTSPAPTANLVRLPEELLTAVLSGIDYSRADPRGWLTWAWQVLARGRIVPAVSEADDEDYVETAFALAGLGHFYDLFNGVHSGGDATAEPSDGLIEAMTGSLTGIQIGRFSERYSLYDTELPERAWGLVYAGIGGQAARLQPKLLELLGAERLLASLVVSAGYLPFLDAETDEYEEEDEYEDEYEEDGPTGPTTPLTAAGRGLAADADSIQDATCPSSELGIAAFDPYLPEVLGGDLLGATSRTYEWLSGDLDLG